MIDKKSITKFLAYLLSMALVIYALGYYDKENSDQFSIILYILFPFIFSFLITYWENVHLPNSRRSTTKKYLNKLEELGFVFREDEYQGMYNSYSISISYFRNDGTKLPNLRISIPNEINSNESAHNKVLSPNHNPESKLVLVEYEISDMRTIFEEAISELDFITTELNELEEKTKS
jgi:hypothetical protein